ncbi:hypothetical protein ONS95_011093 [Cadophora gregata]|uniref:uncharacterized protein n=1 Tax=Cadophora gregata TaxID=51156 RepID=UPI0026DDAEC2|nr:uncharacterized protein ONS95_011093 [Cadophora gregata]KAK0119656.1 hypothetical protein ONS95_011093 [Cadophora gregata]
MEPHQLALAALDEVAHSISTAASHRDAGNVLRAAGDIQPSIKNKEITKNRAAYTHEPSHSSAAAWENMSLSGKGHNSTSNTSLALKTTTSSNNSQSTTDGHDTVSTPPTSTSDEFSSQSTNADGPLSQLSQLSQLAAAAEPLLSTSSTRPALTIAPTAGQKRTADGQVKPLSASPNSPKARGHSRNTSALSSELRTRLSYAMVKVNNGWQSNSIDEVESLASQAASPTSSTSTLHGRRNLISSPRTAMATLQSHSSSASQTIQTLTPDFDLYPRGDQPSRTYESFWRDHSTPNFPPQRQSTQTPIISPPVSKSLGPPADIRPTASSRRSGTPKFSKPPAMPNNGSNSPYNTSAPRTPLRTDFRDNPVIQTPVQKTIQEQDAIETLLFMSSPGNSGNMGHTFPPPRTQGSPQLSPLRTEFDSRARANQIRRVEFDTSAVSVSADSSEGGAEYRSKMRSKGLSQSKAKSEEMNRFLDEMRDDSSSDEEEIMIKYSSPRRIPAGRV